MLAAFWSGLGGAFAKQWAARVLTPAFAFWAAGAAAVWWHRYAPTVQARGLEQALSDTTAGLAELSVVVQGLVVIMGLALVVASAVIAERLTLPLLRLLEGYWAQPEFLRDALVKHRRKRRQQWATRVRELAVRQRLGDLNTAEFLELRQLEADPSADRQRLEHLRRRRERGLDASSTFTLGRGRRFLHDTPLDAAAGMPTRLGDILRAAERRPLEKYGLDAVVCWYALWLLLPAGVKTELVQARTALDNAARVWLWGAALLVWVPFTWLALPLALLIPALAYYGGILPSARLFGELLGTAFDLYRFSLYDGLHLPRPRSPQEERTSDGPRVTNLLWGGLDEPALRYVSPPTTTAAKADGAS